MKKKVFIIEDNEANIKLYKAIFKKIPNIEVFYETRGDKGLEMIKSGNPDLIILDNDLPKLKGIDICKELRKMDKFKEIPIIAASSSPVEGNRESVFARAGFNKSLSKPLNLKEFKEVMKEFLS